MSLINVHRIVLGIFIDYGLSCPSLFVAFQFNPVELACNRRVSYGPDNSPAGNISNTP